MKILSIDTSSKNFSLALSENEKIVKYRNQQVDRKLSSVIISSIDKLLISAGWELKNVDAVAIGLGPGSFTSLRVGLSTVKGLLFAISKPVIGVSSLDVTAMNVKENNVQVCVILDARRNLFYSCIYEKINGKLIRKSNYMLASLDEIISKIEGPCVFLGDGLKKGTDPFFNIFKNKKGSVPFYLPEKYWYPQARNLSKIVQERFKNKEFDDINKLVPLYLYSKECQIQK